MDEKKSRISKEKSTTCGRGIETGEYHLYEAYKRQLNRIRNEIEKAKRNFKKKARGQYKEIFSHSSGTLDLKLGQKTASARLLITKVM